MTRRMRRHATDFMWCLTTLLLLGTMRPLIAQQTPDESFSGRPCEKSLHLGFNSTQGNSDTLALLLGGNYCRPRPKGRWEIDLDANVLRSSGRAETEHVELEGVDEFHFGRDWVLSVFGTAAADHAGGVDSRFLAGSGIGKQREIKWRSKQMSAGLHAGFAYTIADHADGTEESFPEAWLKTQLAVPFTDHASVKSVFLAFMNVGETDDYRLDLETDFNLVLTKRFSVRTGFEVRWDERPAATAEELDASTHTMMVISWGGTGDGQ